MKREPEAVLEVCGLHIRRGNVVILDHVSWRVEPGQHWVILGANGSGKTSLLSALTGYLTPSGGQIAVLGQRYGETDWRELRKRVGLVSSSVRQRMPEFEPALETIVSGKYAMIDLWGRITRADRAGASRILDQIECGYIADRPWAFLSQGERQRVLIGRALMARPAALILDEPCAGLDPVAREHFLQFINRLGRKKRAPTLVLVTHHVEEIMPVFSHALLLRAGRVVAGGRKQKVLRSGFLSRAFNSSVNLRTTHGRWTLAVNPSAKAVM
ncbi:MAG: ABC transporter [Verrucomicrobia bacterium]|nr:MAG: ABC transporter [Verrucomicrobiota bacterium]